MPFLFKVNRKKENAPGRPVSRVLSSPRRGLGDHLSRRAVAGALVQPTRNSPSEEEEDGPPPVPRRKPCPCLALLPVGVAWPPHCCVRRWSLTPPFHPCAFPQRGWRGMFLWPVPIPYGIPGITRHRVLWSADFPRRLRKAPRSPSRPGAISSYPDRFRESIIYILDHEGSALAALMIYK
jgi:hypothetical protein